MNKIRLVIILLLIIPNFIFTQTFISDDKEFLNEIYDNEYKFKPLEANTFEPRVGAFVQTNSKKLRLDIGSNLEISKFDFNLGKNLIISTINSEFMTWTRLKSQSNFKFPVETSDYYFGLNYTFYNEIGNGKAFNGRLRIAHISSHIVDGYLKDSNTLSINPFVYSREFLDATFSYKIFHNNKYSYKYRNDYIDDFRIYFGLNSVFSRRPKDANIFIPNIGFDGTKIIPYLPGIYLNLFLTYGYDFKLIGFNNIYTGVNSFQVGLKFNFPHTSYFSGIGINYYLYNGKSIHGMFYNQRDSYSALGFQIYY